MDFFVPAVAGIQWPINSLQLGNGAQGLGGPDGGDPPDIPPASRVTAARASTNPAAVLQLYAVLLVKVLAAGNAGGPPVC